MLERMDYIGFLVYCCLVKGGILIWYCIGVFVCVCLVILVIEDWFVVFTV